MSCLAPFFADLKDPRAANVGHRLGDVIVMMIAAALCGQTSATDIALFAAHRKAALNRIVSYDRAPSHDTVSRLLRLIDADAFAALFARFAAGFAKAVTAHGGAEVVALDGKALRRAYETGRSTAPPMMVAAFAVERGLVLATAGGARKSETEGAAEVIDLLDLAGKIVTADALHCDHDMAGRLHDAKADYVLGLKRNRADWYDAAEAALAASPAQARCESRGHGRIERREAAVVPAPAPRTAGHKAYGRVVSQRGDEAPVTRYFLMSRRLDADELLRVTRAHWQIENALHWVLDVHLGEDLSRARTDHAPANAALIKRLARNLLQLVDTPKTPISHRIRKCMWRDDYLLTALAQMR